MDIDKPTTFDNKEEAIKALEEAFNVLSKEEFVEYIDNLTEWEIKGEFRNDILAVFDSVHQQVMGFETQITEEEYDKEIPRTFIEKSKSVLLKRKDIESNNIIQFPKRS